MRRGRPCEYLALDELDEVLHLPLHFLHAFAHVQNDGNTRDVNAQVAGKAEYEFEPLNILIRVKARIALSTRRLEQTFTLVKTKGLRMNAIHLGNRRDHVGALFASFHKRSF